MQPKDGTVEFISSHFRVNHTMSWEKSKKNSPLPKNKTFVAVINILELLLWVEWPLFTNWCMSLHVWTCKEHLQFPLLIMSFGERMRERTGMNTHWNFSHYIFFRASNVKIIFRILFSGKYLNKICFPKFSEKKEFIKEKSKTEMNKVKLRDFDLTLLLDPQRGI